MPAAPTPATPAPVWRDRLRRLRRRVDWMMLFPAAAAIAWGFGESAVAMVLVVVLPVCMALQAGRRGLVEAPIRTADRHPIQRTAVQNFVDEVLEDCATRDRTTAVLLIQIDDLHVANGEWGTELSETVMDRVVQRISATMRGQDAVFRSSDDCLTLVLNPTRRADLEVVMNIVDRVQAAVAEPISIRGRSIRVRSCIGLCSEAMAPARTGAALLAAADCALRIASRQGGDTVRAFTADLQTQVETDHKLSTRIDAALESGEIRAWFQPQIQTTTDRIAGFEALARWHHPDLGVLTPGQFLGAIASAGRMAELGNVMLRAALEALVEWDRIGLDVPHVGVNVSLEELSDPRLAERLTWQVDRYGLSPARVAVEILETVTLRENDETIVRNITALREAGFQLDLDDFGTGAASISHIARFGVHRIKLDRSFIHNIDGDADQRRVVGAILRLAENLGIDTLAEGVERAEERDCLIRLGCPHLQGFGIARPMPFDDATTWARAQAGGKIAALHHMRPHGTA
ncbi:bifunctional diguanylate cyclase/phosphodiesterase [Jannaschia sp. M317]|uniref:bifunctional diguanylate cyclase/phosphodiesterase n=1 Tax=Jannaschia sp. M317 TaxID=2867011 RepID=UPI0021A7BDFF|nr:bifunctional diguanylate cyclase/phosphodiesterase [Jannaschia sp. M317]UWQ17475.1 bifunctional diguanylate cyclase/phosphodiesterase [Jannaschia sp. M317]